MTKHYGLSGPFRCKTLNCLILISTKNSHCLGCQKKRNKKKRVSSEFNDSLLHQIIKKKLKRSITEKKMKNLEKNFENLCL